MRPGHHLKILTGAIAFLAAALWAGPVPTPAYASPREALDKIAGQLTARVDGREVRVLLLGITDPAGVTTDLERYLSDKLAAALTATGRVSLTDEAARQAALAEIRANLADVIDPRTAQEAGRLAGAAWLVKGTAYVFPETRRAELLLQIVRAETGEYWQVEGPVPLDASLLGLRRQKVAPPREPVRRAPLSLEMMVVASRPDGKGRDADLGVVREGDRLRSNDDLKVYFRTNADAHVYLVWVDSHGKATLQFPSRDAGTDNRVRGGVVHSVPEGTRWYYLDQQPGLETLYLVASHEPVPSLTALLRRAETGALQADASAARHEVERLFADLQTRGAAGVRSGPSVSVAGKGPASAVTAEVSLVRGYAQAIRRLTFRHEHPSP